MCFCDAESVLSAVAKFLVQLLREGEGRGEMEEGDRERESGERTEYGGAGNGNRPKRQQIWHLGKPLGLPPCHTF